MKSSFQNILFCLSLLILCVCVSCIEFDLDARSSKCFREELPNNFDVYGEYEAFPGYQQNVDLRISDQEGRIIIDRSDVGKGDFSFVAKEGGEYSFCFYNRLNAGVPYHAGLKRRVAFDVLTGTEAFDYASLARKDHLKPVEVNLKIMEDIVKSIHKQYSYFRKRESRMRHTNDSTSSRVSWLGTFSLIFMVGFAICQVLYLKSYFKKKKII